MPIRLLISDLDGTLLGPDGRITPPTAEALQRARRAGLPLLVATGRSWKTASPLLAEAGVAADFVLLNGAEARTAQGELLRAVSLPPAAARHAVAVLQRYLKSTPTGAILPPIPNCAPRRSSFRGCRLSGPGSRRCARFLPFPIISMPWPVPVGCCKPSPM